MNDCDLIFKFLVRSPPKEDQKKRKRKKKRRKEIEGITLLMSSMWSGTDVEF
jgi:hypothetical protein